MIVLGVDPGIASTGFGVVALRGGRQVALAGGVIRTPAGQAVERRLATIHTRLGELMDEHRPEALALEQLYFGRNVSSAAAVGEGRGVALLAAGLREVPCFSYTPQQIKSAVCGSGAAAKDQVQRMVQTLLGLTGPAPADHAADALAVALCHSAGAPLRTAVARAAAPPRAVAR